MGRSFFPLVDIGKRPHNATGTGASQRDDTSHSISPRKPGRSDHGFHHCLASSALWARAHAASREITRAGIVHRRCHLCIF